MKRILFSTFFFLLIGGGIHAQVWPLEGETPQINSSYGTYANTHDNTHFHSGIDIPGEAGVSRVVTLSNESTIFLVVQQAQSINIYTYNSELEKYFVYVHCEELNSGINLYNNDYVDFSTPHAPTSSSLPTINGEGVTFATLAESSLEPIMDNSNPPNPIVERNDFIYDHLHLSYGHGYFNSDGNFAINLMNSRTNPLEMALGANPILSTADPGNMPPELGPWFIKRVLPVPNSHLYIKKNDILRKGGINGKVRVMREITDIMNSYYPDNPDESTPPKKEDPDTWDEVTNKIYDANVGSPYKIEFGIQNSKDVFIIEKQYFEYTGSPFSATTNSLLYDSNPNKIAGVQYKYVYNLTNINTETRALDRYWNTKLKKGTQWDGDNATNITDARYPDDKYKLWVRAADIVAACDDVAGHFVEEELEMIIDNFLPWITSAMVYDADGLIAAQHWEFYESVDIMCLWEDITPTPTDGTSPLQIIVNSSEPMEYLHLAIPTMGINNVIGVPTDEDRMVWSFTVSIPSSAVDDEYDLSITGQDYNGNELEALQGYEPNDCIFPDDLPSSRDEDGNWTPTPNPGSDLVHSFLLENCPSANEAPVIVPLVENIEQNVCIYDSELLFINGGFSDDTDLSSDLIIDFDASTLPFTVENFSNPELGDYFYIWENIGEGYLGTHVITITITDNDPDCPRSSTVQHIVHITCGDECPEECPVEPCSDLVLNYDSDVVLIPDCISQANVPINGCWGETISIEVSDIEGNNYDYIWSDCSNCNTPIRDLLPGTYTVEVEADNGCMESITFVVDGDGTTDEVVVDTHEDEIPIDHGDTTIPNSELMLRTFEPVPNPFNDLVEISYVIIDKRAGGDSNPVLQTSHVRAELYDYANSQFIGTIYEEEAIPVGKTQSFTYDGRDLRRGTYILVMHSRGGSRGRVIVKM